MIRAMIPWIVSAVIGAGAGIAICAVVLTFHEQAAVMELRKINAGWVKVHEAWDVVKEWQERARQGAQR